jgi:hypothetical protein
LIVDNGTGAIIDPGGKLTFNEGLVGLSRQLDIALWVALYGAPVRGLP